MTTLYATQLIEIAIAHDDNDTDLPYEGRTIADLTTDERSDYDFALALVIAHDPTDGYLRAQTADGEIYELSDAYARPLDFSELLELIA